MGMPKQVLVPCLPDEPEHVALAVGSDPQRDIHRPVRDVALADLEHDRIDQDHRIDRVQRPGLPQLQVGQDLVGDLGDQLA